VPELRPSQDEPYTRGEDRMREGVGELSMSELKEFDDTVHDEDEYETPDILYYGLCFKYKISPKLDVAANRENSKTQDFMDDALDIEREWYCHGYDVWCNPPHTKTEQFVKRADQQWRDWNINIMMIVPANAICAHYFDDIFVEYHAEYHRIPGRPTFLQNGKPTKYPSRNSYFVVIWRKQDPKPSTVL